MTVCRLSVGLAVVSALACTPVPQVDRLFVGGTLHDGGTCRAAAMAVKEGRIVGLIDPDDTPRWSRAAAEVIDLAGAHVYPGFTEAHGHFLGYGAALEQVDLVGTKSFGEVIARVRETAATVPRGEWIVGRGWDQNDWSDPVFPRHGALSTALPDHPVLLRRIDGHAVLANAAGLAAARISAASPDPPGGRIIRDERGEPTGVLVDTACDLVESAIPEPTSESLSRRAVLAGERLASLGFTEIHDAGTSSLGLAVLRGLVAERRLPVRVYAMIEGADDDAMRNELAAGPSVTRDGMLAVRAVKLYADGALGSRGALLSEPYSDEPASRGLEVTTVERLSDLIRRAGEAGFQPCAHAIGDAAVTRILDLYERLLGPRAGTLRARIEHAQIVRPEDVPRFASLAVIASVQPTHCTSDMPWAPRRLGEERIPWAYRWRSLVDAGARVCLGSDVPVEDPDPRLGLWAAITRRTPDGTPADGWNLHEALSPAQAVAGYTSWAAYAAFEEDWRGALRPGFAADLTVTDRDLEGGGAQAAREARILRTVVAGRDAFVARGAE